MLELILVSFNQREQRCGIFKFRSDQGISLTLGIFRHCQLV
jgi:hypothetical protein